MRLRLEKRYRSTRLMMFVSPVLAVALTVLVGGGLFAAQGLNPLTSLYIYFVDPLMSVWSLEELTVKVAPLVLIGVGLAISFRANVWNIGAEGQLTMGAIAGCAVPILWHEWQSPSVLAVMVVLASLGGAAYASIPAVLKNRFGVNEILTSLMLVYVAQYCLDWFVRGPWRDPDGYNFPKSVTFDGWQLLPTFGDGRVHLGIAFALLAVIVAFVLLARTLKGFELFVSGQSPRAGAFAGFSRTRVVWFCFLLSGAMAGLAGLCEVVGPGDHLQPMVSPGYGFTAIIVAFLGRLNPIGVLFAGILLGISYLGGEAAQVELGLSAKTAQAFQGTLLFFILACDMLVLYRIRWARSGL